MKIDEYTCIELQVMELAKSGKPKPYLHGKTYDTKFFSDLTLLNLYVKNLPSGTKYKRREQKRWLVK